VRIQGEVCHVFIDKATRQKYAVSNRLGTVYEITTDEAGELLTSVPLKSAAKD